MYEYLSSTHQLARKCMSQLNPLNPSFLPNISINIIISYFIPFYHVCRVEQFPLKTKHTHTHTSPTSTIQPSNTLKILPLRVRFRLRHHHRTRSRYWEGCRIQGRVIDFRAPWHILRRNETLPRFGLFGELVWLGFNC